MKETQCQTLARLLSRKTGVTSMEIVQMCQTVAPHRRLADMKAKGWLIVRRAVPGQNYGRYFGKQVL